MVRVKRMHKTNVLNLIWSRQVGTLIVVVLISGFNLFYFDVASADITIDGETVHAETDSYVVKFDKWHYNLYPQQAYQHRLIPCLPVKGKEGGQGYYIIAISGEMKTHQQVERH